LALQDFPLPAPQVVAILDWFEEQFVYDDWTRVMLVCERGGPDSATVTTQTGGPREVDYVGFDQGPFRGYLDERRSGLEELGRGYYGKQRRKLFWS
jgi:hypothetical protein